MLPLELKLARGAVRLCLAVSRLPAALDGTEKGSGQENGGDLTACVNPTVGPQWKSLLVEM